MKTGRTRHIGGDGEAFFTAIRNGNLEKVKEELDKGLSVNAVTEAGNPALILASLNNKLDIARFLINAGASINATNKEGETALMFICANGSLEFVKFCIEEGANINAADKRGETSLVKASGKGNLEIVKFLLEEGVNVNRLDRYKETALFYATRENKPAVVNLLVEKGANVNVVNRDGVTPLYEASHENKLEVVKILIEKGADVNAVIGDSTTILNDACSHYGTQEIVKLLIENGANVNAADNYRYTPLMWASIIGELETVKLLVNAGANRNVIRDGRTILDMAKTKEIRAYLRNQETPRQPRNIPKGSENAIMFDEIQNNDLMVNFPRNNSKTEYNYGTYYKNSNSVRALKTNPVTRRHLKNSNFKPYKARLVGGVQTRSQSWLINRSLLIGVSSGTTEDVQAALEKGADVNFEIPGKGFTILMLASTYSNKTVVKMLLEKGAHVNKKTTDKEFTALMYANESKESTEITKLLIDHGADVNATSNAGETALMWSSRRGLVEVVQLLIDNGADINRVTDDGETALSLAENSAVRELLLKEKAKATTNYRNIPKGTENSLLFDEIQNNDLMVNFPRNNVKTEYNYGSYYKNGNSVRALKKNPQTRRNLRNTNFSFYKARLV